MNECAIGGGSSRRRETTRRDEFSRAEIERRRRDARRLVFFPPFLSLDVERATLRRESHRALKLFVGAVVIQHAHDGDGARNTERLAHASLRERDDDGHVVLSRALDDFIDSIVQPTLALDFLDVRRENDDFTRPGVDALRHLSQAVQ